MSFDFEHACNAADVDSGLVRERMQKRPAMTVDEAIAYVRNRAKQAARRATHDTGYERRDGVNKGVGP